MITLFLLHFFNLCSPAFSFQSNMQKLSFLFKKKKIVLSKKKIFIQIGSYYSYSHYHHHYHNHLHHHHHDNNISCLLKQRSIISNKLQKRKGFLNCRQFFFKIFDNFFFLNDFGLLLPNLFVKY